VDFSEEDKGLHLQSYYRPHTPLPKSSWQSNFAAWN